MNKSLVLAAVIAAAALAACGKKEEAPAAPAAAPAPEPAAPAASCRDAALAAGAGFGAVGVAPVADLRAHLLQRLPDYMLPQHLVALPLVLSTRAQMESTAAPSFLMATWVKG